MPIIKSAKKKLRKDRKRTIHNNSIKSTLKKLIKTAKMSKREEAIRTATTALDKATRKNIIHKNKASRIKSALSRLISPGEKNAITLAKTPKKRRKSSK